MALRSTLIALSCVSQVLAQHSHGGTTDASSHGHGGAPAAPAAPSVSSNASSMASSSGHGSSGGGHGHGGSGGAPDPTTENNWFLLKGLLWCWVAILGVTMLYCAFVIFSKYLRTIASINNSTQKFFARPSALHGGLKKHLFDAPLFRTRHHREFRLSKAYDAGTLPSRMQTLFLVGYIAASITLTVIDIPWHKKTTTIYSALVSRTGLLAIMNMLPLFLLAGRNNPLLPLTGISFDTYNLVHRWVGRIAILEALLHMTFWMLGKVAKQGAAAISTSLSKSEFIQSGFIGAVGFGLILLQSPGVIRHAFYETFLIGHQILVGAALGGVWIHLKEFPQQQAIIKGVLGIWIGERAVRLFKIIHGNVGRGGTTAVVEQLPGDALRMTVKMARPWKFRTGAHAYLYMPGVGWWTSHPFSVAWSDEAEPITQRRLTMDPEKGMEMDRTEILEMGEQTMSFIIRRRTGFTEKMWRKAERANGKFTTKCYLEGPYGHQTLHSYGTVLLFAAGVGITHQVPHVRDLVTGYSNGTVAARKVILVWIIQSPEHLEWIRPWMTTILSLPNRREVLKILLFVTRPRSTKEIHSPSSSVQMFPGKPNVQSLVDQEVESSIGAIGVSVCGVGGLADDIRRACRSWMGKANIDFSEESFSW